MIIKMNIDGTIEKVYGSRTFKGSNSVSEIVLFAPFNSQSTVIINFTLPDGSQQPGIMVFSNFSVEDTLNMWTYKMRQNITEMEGRVNLSLEVRSYNDETQVLTTAETYITIEKSTSTVFLDEVDEFLSIANDALARAQTALNENDAQDVRLTNVESDIVDLNTEIDSEGARIDALITEQTTQNERLTAIEGGQEEQDERIETLETAKTAHDVRLLAIEGIGATSLQTPEYNSLTGELKFTRQNGTSVILDLPMEFILDTTPGKNYYDPETKSIILVLVNGTELSIPVDHIYEKIEDDVATIETSLGLLSARVEALELDNIQNKEAIATLQEGYNDHELRMDVLEDDNRDNKERLGSIETRLESTFTADEKAKLEAIPEPDDILTKIRAIMNEAYLVDNDFSLTTKKWVVEQINAVTGVDLSGLIDIDTFNSFKQQIEQNFIEVDKPDFINLTLTQPITTITDKVLDSPQEITSIEGNSQPIVSDEDKTISTYTLDGVKNEIYYENGQAYITIRVDYVNDVLTVLTTPITRLANTVGIEPVVNPSIESVGKNLFDGELGLGSISTTTGQKHDSNFAIRSINYIRIKPNEQYTISNNLGYSNTFKFLYDKNYNFISRVTSETFTTPSNAKYLLFRTEADGTQLDTTVKYMLNKGTTPLPYTPFNSHKLQITGEYYEGDRIINDNGVYYDEINMVKVNLWEWSEISVHGSYTNVYTFGLLNMVSDYNLKNLANGFVNTIDYHEFVQNNRQWRFSNDGLSVVLYIEKPLIQEIMARDSVDEVTAFKTYLEENNIQGIFQLATPITKPSVLIKNEDIDFTEGNTIYLESESGLIPTVHAICAMDLAGQVEKLTEKERFNDTKHQEHDEAIKTINEHLSTVEVNAEVNIIEGIQVNGADLAVDDDRIVNIPLATNDSDGLLSKENHIQIGTNKTNIEALKGAYIFRGSIQRTNAEVTANTTLLTNYIIAVHYREPIAGDVLIDQDNMEWYYDGSNWIDLGQALVGTASSTVDGVIRIGFPEDATNRAVKLNESNQAYVNIPLATNEQPGLMSANDKAKAHSHGAQDFEHVNGNLHVTQDEKETWNGKSVVTSSNTNGRINVDGEDVSVYTHPTTHTASMIVEDTLHRFVTDDEKTLWNSIVGLGRKVRSVSQVGADALFNVRITIEDVNLVHTLVVVAMVEGVKKELDLTATETSPKEVSFGPLAKTEYYFKPNGNELTLWTKHNNTWYNGRTIKYGWFYVDLTM